MKEQGPKAPPIGVDLAPKRSSVAPTPRVTNQPVRVLH